MSDDVRIQALDYYYQTERFPFRDEEWTAIFNAHGQEVRGRNMEIDWKRYRQIELEGRLVWVVARTLGVPAGYSCHYWYKDMHFGDRVAADDLWYVLPGHRGRGVGRKVREIGLLVLRNMGVTATYDLIRQGGPDMTHLGYEAWGTRWMKTL